MSPQSNVQPPPDEREHIQKAQQGNKDAYRALVVAYQDRVFTLVRSLISNVPQAEDLTQEIFIKAYFALPSFKGVSAFYTWLFRIATNHCVDYLRRHPPPEISLDETIDENGEFSRGQLLEAPPSEEPDAPLDSEGDIARLLNTLNPDQRLILSLREVQGCTYEEIATVLNCSVNTIKSRLNRARAALRKAYNVKYGNILKSKTVQKSEEKQRDLRGS